MPFETITVQCVLYDRKSILKYELTMRIKRKDWS